MLIIFLTVCMCGQCGAEFKFSRSKLMSSPSIKIQNIVN